MTTFLLGETDVEKRVSSWKGLQEVVEPRFLLALQPSFVEDHGLEKLPLDVAVERDGWFRGLAGQPSISLLANSQTT